MSNTKPLEVEVQQIKSFSFEEGVKDMVILEERGNYLKILSNEKIYNVLVKSVDEDHKQSVVNVDGYDFFVKVNEPLDLLIKKMGFLRQAAQTVKEVKAPMPGLVLDILVKVGDEVTENQNLLSLEAMKMENIIKSQGKGKVKEVKVTKGEAVDKNQILLIFE
ncbi:MAG: acetyl-CoA carboxylase biotin carboxyl carrier protein subunit [Saprospiraceae bacterium]|nr:acetyl-CoA carboxylase biotin carboxyl carrier protein subunit [Saprospiraceae bacterium]